MGRQCVSLLSACALACRDAPREPTPFELHPPGLWYDTRFAQRAPLLDATARERMEALGVLGYTEGIHGAPATTGVTEWDQRESAPGWNLYCSGHGAEAVLMDMSGETLHRWALPIEALPGAPRGFPAWRGAWRRVHLFPDGSLLALYAYLGLVHVEVDSSPRWHRFSAAHHDFDVLEDGRILVLEQVERDLPGLGSNEPLLDDHIVSLGPGGEEHARLSLIDALRASPWSGLVERSASLRTDVLHTNTLEVLRAAPRVPHDAFRPGRALVCFREIHTVAVVDLDQGRVVWLQQGPWAMPHQPSVLPNGHLLVFDNMGHGGYSRVVELDVVGGNLTWQYAAEPAQDFFSIFSGSAQRLSNGNTLITESYAGRAFEITPRGELVWRFESPHRAGEEGELVAVLSELVRVPPEFSVAWLSGLPSDPDADPADVQPAGVVHAGR